MEKRRNRRLTGTIVSSADANESINAAQMNKMDLMNAILFLGNYICFGFVRCTFYKLQGL